MGTPTVYDVAGRAGVSAATVSRVRRAPVAAAATRRGDHGAGRQVTTPERRVPSGPWTTRSAPGSSSPSTWRGSPGSCIPARPTRKGTTTGAAGR
ncbi:LacI family DNA-binding transcriptional regulator [Streptomyces sp. SID7982]|uniref:LacI family DNA-binding transcriptional regulator n=1 Tax=Streptomyces rutgersensis TaxID=53451 RepID=A0ABX6RLZ0_9ACTN|nr:LacI family DNA-binding transcriptional regulator [Streptomyces sp. SID7982]NEE43052.1 LacI family DNA-binding transcriptional regulator [Streptomyces sp. SID8455]QNE81416.1 LacI family DNA-binding transcriptional regulator [Streptomyces rutgersensis]